MPLFRMRAGRASNSCSGIFTLAFFAFSSLAPSSVEPLSPQRTWNEGDGYEHFIQNDLTMIQIASMEARTSVLLNKGVQMNWSRFSGSTQSYKNKDILNNDKECVFDFVFSNRDISGQLFLRHSNSALLVIEAECFQTADELYNAHALVFLNRKHCLAAIVNFGTLLVAVWWNNIALFNLPKVA